jgi:hypothetical protein
MTTRTMRHALVIALAGAFAITTSASFAAPKAKPPQDSYEAWGRIKDGAPPVPGAALSSYKPGMCWKITSTNWQTGEYISCSECKKLKASVCPH